MKTIRITVKTMIGNTIEKDIPLTDSLKKELINIIEPIEKDKKGRVTDIIFDTL